MVPGCPVLLKQRSNEIKPINYARQRLTLLEKQTSHGSAHNPTSTALCKSLSALYTLNTVEPYNLSKFHFRSATKAQHS